MYILSGHSPLISEAEARDSGDMVYYAGWQIEIAQISGQMVRHFQRRFREAGLSSPVLNEGTLD